MAGQTGSSRGEDNKQLSHRNCNNFCLQMARQLMPRKFLFYQDDCFHYTCDNKNDHCGVFIQRTKTFWIIKGNLENTEKDWIIKQKVDVSEFNYENGYPTEFLIQHGTYPIQLLFQFSHECTENRPRATIQLTERISITIPDSEWRIK
jgi:hypothetical protein